MTFKYDSSCCIKTSCASYLLLTKNLSYCTVCLHILQVLAACLYPELVNSDKLPVDVRQRAQRLLGECVGRSIGKSCVCDITLDLLNDFNFLSFNFY